jgi:hypothetical protein
LLMHATPWHGYLAGRLRSTVYLSLLKINSLASSDQLRCEV